MALEVLFALSGAAVLAVALVFWRRRGRRDERETVTPPGAPTAATPEPAPTRATPPDAAAPEISSPPKITAAREPVPRSVAKPKRNPPPSRPVPEPPGPEPRAPEAVASKAAVPEITAPAEPPETSPQHKPMPPALREKARRKALKKFREWSASDDWCLFAVASTDRSDRGEIEAIAILDHEGKLLLERRLRGRAPTVPDRAAPRWPEVHDEISDALAGFRRVLAYDAGLDARMLEQTCARYGLDAPNTRWEGVMQAYAAFRGMWNMTTQGFQVHSLDAAARFQGLSVPDSGGPDGHGMVVEDHGRAEQHPVEEARQVIALLRAVAAVDDEQKSAATKGARG